MTTVFLKAMGERALKTFCQTLAALLVAGGATDLLSVGWKQALSVSLMAALMSVLTSIGSSRVGDPDSPSMTMEKA
jgi:hypothetical protein